MVDGSKIKVTPERISNIPKFMELVAKQLWTLLPLLLLLSKAQLSAFFPSPCSPPPQKKLFAEQEAWAAMLATALSCISLLLLEAVHSERCTLIWGTDLVLVLSGAHAVCTSAQWPLYSYFRVPRATMFSVPCTLLWCWEPGCSGIRHTVGLCRADAGLNLHPQKPTIPQVLRY